jgi:hypothetical protein
MARHQPCGAVGALVDHGLGENDERRQLLRVEIADLRLEQNGVVIAKQSTGRRIGVDDRISIGIDDDLGLRRMVEKILPERLYTKSRE